MFKGTVSEATARSFVKWLEESPKGRTMDSLVESPYIKYKVRALIAAAEAIGVKIQTIPRSSCTTKFRLKVEKAA